MRTASARASATHDATERDNAVYAARQPLAAAALRPHPTDQAILGNQYSEQADQPGLCVQRSADGSCAGCCGACRNEAEPIDNLQAGLEVSAPGDPHEVAADRIADQVVQCMGDDGSPDATAGVGRDGDQRDNPIAGKIGRVVGQDGVRTGSAGGARAETVGVGAILDSTRGYGQPLPSTVRRQMESAFGVDFSEVRLHTDEQAVTMSRQLGARAFTQGNDIYFNAGMFDPDTGTGRHLLAHELTHTLQQTGNAVVTSWAVDVADVGNQEEPVVVRTIQRSPASSVPMPPPARAAPPNHLEQWLKEERDAGLLDLPWRGYVPEIPNPPETPSAPPATPAQGYLEVPPPESVPGLAPGPGVSHAPSLAPGLGFGAALRLISSVGAGLVIFFYSNHAPYWMDETSVSGWGFQNENEWKWWHKTLSQMQRDYLGMLSMVRRSKKDVSLDGETDPFVKPSGVTEPAEGRGRTEAACFSQPVKRLGGNTAHDAYAFKVTGSHFDHFVRTPSGLFITYDGLSRPSLVWEVKTGYRWIFYDPESHSLALQTVARWDAQRQRGLQVANDCGYRHVWSVTDPWIRDSLLIRWGGNPFVYNTPA